MNKIKTLTAAALTAGVMVGAVAAPASAISYTGKIVSYFKDTSNQSATPFRIVLTTGQVYMSTTTTIWNCQGAGIFNNIYISMTNLGKIQAANKTVTVSTTSSGVYKITCV